MRASEVPTRKVAELVPYARNSRTHSEAQVAQIAASIREFGFTNPVLIDGEGEIIAGHGRVMAAKLLGLADVPVLVLDHLTDTQRRAYVIADNKLALNAGWDEALLRSEIQALGDEGFDLSLAGFDWPEVAELLKPPPVRKGKIDDDQAPEAPTRACSRAGDTWILDRHRLRVGDATSAADLDALLQGKEVDLVWTDPPYNVAVKGKAGSILNDDMEDAAFRAFLDATFDAYARALRPGGVIYVAHAETERVNFTAAFVDAGLKLSQVRIWVKQSATLSRQDFNWQHEPILYGWKEGAGHYFAGDFTKTTVVETPADLRKMSKADLVAALEQMIAAQRGTILRHDRPTKSDLHPTMKPVALVEEMIEASSLEGDLVLDLFGGSGSTLIAAEKTGRDARLMELDPRFADVIVTRWQDFTGRTATLEATGNTFADTRDARLQEAASE